MVAELASNSTGKQTNLPQWKDAAAGATAGAFSRTLLAPVERVKLLKQLQGTYANDASLAGRSNMSALCIARDVFHNEGVLAFWRGNVPNVMRVSGTAAIHFSCMDYFKRAAEPWVTRHSDDSSANGYTNRRSEHKRKRVASFVSGGLAGATSTTVLYPVEFLRTRLAMDLGGGTDAVKPRQYRGMTHVLKSIWKTDGVQGLYQGYGVALVGGVVYRIILLGGYDAIKSELLFRKERTDRDHVPQHTDLSWGERILSAQAISLIAGTTAYPFDSVRRRMMMQAGKSVRDRSYKSSMHCITTVYSKEGLLGFYLGIGPNIVRSVGGALVLVGYDTIKALL